MIQRCAGSSAAKRLKVARLRRAKWAASKRNGSRHPRTFLLLPPCPVSGSILCTAEGCPVALCSTMSPSRWPRSPSHGKCSKRFCGSSRSYGRSHHPRQHEAFDCHAFKRNRQEECVQMPVKIARSAPRPSFGLPELLVAIHSSRQSCCKAGKARIFTPVRESSEESRANIHPETACHSNQGGYKNRGEGRDTRYPKSS